MCARALTHRKLRKTALSLIVAHPDRAVNSAQQTPYDYITIGVWSWFRVCYGFSYCGAKGAGKIVVVVLR